jgi:flagellar hook-associated protein 2
MPAPLDADETVTINGVDIDLTVGMTQADVLAAINSRTKETGVKVFATGADGTGTGDTLTFRTTAYGSAVSLSVTSSRSFGDGATSGVGNQTITAADPGGESGSGTGEEGLDVAGTIHGEPATGSGQMLEGDDGNATTDGLKLRITASTTGSLGSIQLFAGIAYTTEQTIDAITSAAGGPLEGEMETIDQRLADLQELIDSREEAIRRREETLRLKFIQMEQALAQFQTQSASLASQLAALR